MTSPEFMAPDSMHTDQRKESMGICSIHGTPKRASDLQQSAAAMQQAPTLTHTQEPGQQLKTDIDTWVNDKKYHFSEFPGRSETKRRMKHCLEDPPSNSELDLSRLGGEPLTENAWADLIPLLGQLKDLTGIRSLKLDFCEALQSGVPHSLRRTLMAMFPGGLEFVGVPGPYFPLPHLSLPDLPPPDFPPPYAEADGPDAATVSIHLQSAPKGEHKDPSDPTPPGGAPLPAKQDAAQPQPSVPIQATPLWIQDQQLFIIEQYAKPAGTQFGDTDLTRAADRADQRELLIGLRWLIPLLKSDVPAVAAAADAALWARTNLQESVLSLCVSYGHQWAVERILSSSPSLARLGQVNHQGYTVLAASGKRPRGDIPRMLMDALLAFVLNNNNPQQVKEAFDVIGCRTGNGGNTALEWALSRPDDKNGATREDRIRAHTAMLERLVPLLDSHDPVITSGVRAVLNSGNAKGESALTRAVENNYTEAEQVLRGCIGR